MTIAGTALDLLLLLADDAPVGELERVGSALGPDGAAAAGAALRVRTVLDDRRRREAELSALVDTARDLASLSETGDVLDAIVRRARALLRADVTYLTLFDPERGDTFMRATAGSVSARFQSLRLPVGAGLGGLVAQSRAPYWTTAYPADQRYRHTGEIDEAVADEGIVAICGTPLLVGSEFLGVLFAANRAARPFVREEVALLGSLAALAAVSLVQTRQLAETAAALAALRAAHAGIEQAAAAHDRFAQVVLEGGDVGDLATALGQLLDGWVRVLDGDGAPAAAHGDPSAPADLAALTAAAGEGNGRLVTRDGLHAVAVVAAGQRLGTLVLGGVADLDPGRVRTVERAAMVTALVLLFRQRAAEAERRVRADVLLDLLAVAEPDTTPASLLDRVAQLGVSPRRPHVLLVCRCPSRLRARVALDAEATVGRVGLVAEHDGAVVVLLPGSDAGGAAEQLARRPSGPESAVTVGAVGPVTPARGLARAHADARRAAEALERLGRAGQSATLSDLGFAGALLGGEPDVAGYVRDVLGSVLDYDAIRGTDLLTTLERYFVAGQNLRRAAAELHVHHNTVVRRLARVTALLGQEWQEPERAMEIQLALRLHRLS